MSEKNTFSIKTIAGISIYTIVMFLIFFYFLFPFNLLENKIKSLLLEKMEGKATISSLNIGFPSKLTIKKFEFQEGNKEFMIDEIRGKLLLHKILTGNVACKFSINAYDGVLSGQFRQSLFKNRKRYFSCTTEKLDLGKIKLINELFGASLSTKVAFNLTSSCMGSDLKSLNGQWSLSTGSGYCKPQNFPRFNFDVIEATGLIRSGIVHIKNIKAESKDVSVMAGGKVSLNKNIPHSHVDLNVKLKVGGEFKKLLGVFSTFLPKESNDGFIYITVAGAANNLHYSAR